MISLSWINVDAIFFGMKKNLVILVSVLLISGCTNEVEEWNIATKADTSEDYVTYFEQFPEGDFSDEARSHLRKYFRTLHVKAFETLSGNDDNYEKAEKIYEDILRIDPKNALVFNNQAYILSARIFDERKGNKSEPSSSDIDYLEDVVELLERAESYANRRRVAPEQIAMILERGAIVSAAQPTKVDTRSSSLKGLTSHRRKKIMQLLNIPYKKVPSLGALAIKGTVVNAAGTPIGGQDLWLMEGKLKENGVSDQTTQATMVTIYDKNAEVINPHTQSDKYGNFIFKVDSDNRDLDPFADKLLIIVAAASVVNSQEKTYILLQDNKPVLFQADLDKPEMILGRLVIGK